MIIDSHAHLFYPDYREDIDAVLARSREAGVGFIIVPATDLAMSHAAI